MKNIHLNLESKFFCHRDDYFIIIDVKEQGIKVVVLRAEAHEGSFPKKRSHNESRVKVTFSTETYVFPSQCGFTAFTVDVRDGM